MKLHIKILGTWSVAVGVMLLTFLLPLPHVTPTVSGFIAYSLLLLLLIISLFLMKFEPVRKNKWIFVNFAAFFGLALYFHGYNFVTGPTQRFLLNQYVSLGAYFFLLSLSIVYITVDLLFRDFRTYVKYGLALLIVGAFFVYYYIPVLSDPTYILHTTDAKDYKALYAYASQYAQKHGVSPSVEELAASCELSSANNGSQGSDDEWATKVARVAELRPYLEGDNNYKVLLLKPLYLNTVYMSVLAVGFIVLFFGYQYRKDPPQGAYIEKMMFVLLLYCTLEIFHALSFIKSVEWQSFARMFEVGQYVSGGVLLMLVGFFSLRLKFIRSVNGEFYEQEIHSNPNAVTRWRDALDNMVVAHFFNPEKVFGRMFVEPRAK